MGNTPQTSQSNIDLPPQAPEDATMSNANADTTNANIISATPPPVPVATATSLPVAVVATPQVQTSQPAEDTVTKSTATPADDSMTAEGSSSGASSRPSHGVSIDIIPEHEELAKGQAHDTMVGVHLTAAEVKEDDEGRAPIDVVVVSDLSGSMSGEKLRQLKETIKLLGHELAKKDRVGLVTFESEVDEPLKLSSDTFMSSTGRAKLDGLVDRYRTAGMTNLSGGLFAGIGQFPRQAAASSKVRTCLLLTDGQANRGVIDTKGIVSVMESMLDERSGLTVHTFGYGGDHNSEMLQAVSDAANGSYYFIESNDEIRAAFGDCLGGLLTVVAQNIEVCIEAVGDAVITKIHDKAVVCEEAGKRYTMKFTDLYGEEERDLLVSVRLPAGSTGGDAVRARLQYVDVVQGKFSSESATCAISRPVAVSPAKQAPNKHITVQRTRIEVAQTIEEASTLADRGDLATARRRLMTLQTKTAAMKHQSPELEMLQNFDDDLRECVDSVSSQSAYRAKGNHNMRNISHTHMQQRSQPSKVAWKTMLGSGSVAPPTSYQTSAKRKKATKFMSS